MKLRSRLLRRGAVPVLALLVALGGCTTTQSAPARAGGTGELAALAPQLSVERFLMYVNERNLDAMARLFGTADGPVQRDAQEIELQMDIIQNVLAHDDYRIVGETMVAGQEHPTRRVGVNLTIGGEVIPDVGFQVVQTSAGSWMVQNIDLEAITNR